MVGGAGGWRRGRLEAWVVGTNADLCPLEAWMVEGAVGLEAQVVGGMDGWMRGWLEARVVGGACCWRCGWLEARVVGGAGGWY